MNPMRPTSLKKVLMKKYGLRMIISSVSKLDHGKGE